MVDAPAAQVLDVVADVAGYPAWSPELRSVEVLDESDGRVRRARFDLAAGPVADTYVLDYRWDVAPDGTGVMAWSLVEAGLLSTMDGSYTLVEEQGRTTVTYELTVGTRLPMLGAVRRRAEQRIVDGALRGLRDRVEGRR